MRSLVFHAQAWEDFTYWLQNDRTTTKRFLRLIAEALRDPFEGIGKPEPLKHGLSGYWSRRINEEHRIIYKIEADSLFIAQLRYHY